MKVEVSNQNIIDSLHDSLIDHGNIVLLGKFLAELSERKPAASEQCTIDELVVKPFATSGSRREYIERATEEMIAVSGRAGHYAATNENGPALVKLKLMLSYIMLHLTLKHGIRRYLQAADPLAPPRTIEGKKIRVLQERLAHNGLSIATARLTEYVRYGKILWDMISVLGIIALPMISIGGPAITTLCKKNGPTTNHLPVIASRLSNNLSWMALCKTWSPIVMEIVFTNTKQRYTSQELFNLLIAEPIGTYTVARLHQYYLQSAKNIPPIRHIDRQHAIVPPALQSASNLYTLLGIQIPLFPVDNYPNPVVRNIKLVGWLLNQEEQATIRLSPDLYQNTESVVELPLATFRELLGLGDISNKLVGFLGDMWNRRALPGWAMISPKDSRNVLDAQLGGDPQMAITIALGGRRYNLRYENVFLPILFENLLFPLHISLKEKVATLYLLQNSGHHIADAIQEIEVSV